MATITVRIDDSARDQLQSMADGAGLTLSDLLRETLLARLDRADRDETPVNGETRPGVVPESLGVVDRQQLALLHRILSRLVNEDDEHGGSDAQLRMARSLEHGWVADYNTEFGPIETELSRRDCGFVWDILDMFRFTKQSIDKLGAKAPAELRGRLEFRGFDHNDRFEGRLAEYAHEMIRRGKWRMLAEHFSDENDGGNSHLPMLSRYRRMLAAFAPIWRGKLDDPSDNDFVLSVDELRAVANA